MGGDEETLRTSREESQRDITRKLIETLYSELLKLGYLYRDLYDMTIIELDETLTNRKKGLAYEIWRLASFTRSPFIKDFPSSPKEAMPELFPVEKGIKMPDFLKEKAIKRGVI